MQLRVPCQNLVVAEQDGCLGVNRGILPFPGCWERLAVSLALALIFNQRPDERFPSCIFECRHKTHLPGHENRDRRANGSPLKALLLFIFRSPFDGGGSPLLKSPVGIAPSPVPYAMGISFRWPHQNDGGQAARHHLVKGGIRKESPTACPPSRRGELAVLRAHLKGGTPTAVIRHPLWDVTIFSHFFGCLR